MFQQTQSKQRIPEVYDLRDHEKKNTFKIPQM